MLALGAWIAKSVLMQSPIGGFVRAIGGGLKRFFGALDGQGWLGVVAATLLAWQWIAAAGEARHWKKQSGRFEQLYTAELEHQQRIAGQALALKSHVDGLAAGISTLLKGLSDAEALRIHRSAGALLVSGPGKAACAGGPVAPAAAGGSGEADRTGDAAVPAMHQFGGTALVAMPWDQAVDYAEQHDLFRTEALSWRDWYRRLLAVWPSSAATDPHQEEKP